MTLHAAHDAAGIAAALRSDIAYVQTGFDNARAANQAAHDAGAIGSGVGHISPVYTVTDGTGREACKSTHIQVACNLAFQLEVLDFAILTKGRNDADIRAVGIGLVGLVVLHTRNDVVLAVNHAFKGILHLVDIRDAIQGNHGELSTGEVDVIGNLEVLASTRVVSIDLGCKGSEVGGALQQVGVLFGALAFEAIACRLFSFERVGEAIESHLAAGNIDLVGLACGNSKAFNAVEFV